MDEKSSLSTALSPKSLSEMEGGKKRRWEDATTPEITVEDAGQLIEPFTREQLLDLLKQATSKAHKMARRMGSLSVFLVVLVLVISLGGGSRGSDVQNSKPQVQRVLLEQYQLQKCVQNREISNWEL